MVLPSSPLGSANYKENEGTWDGKWVEIDAVVTAVGPLLSAPGYSSTACSLSSVSFKKTI